MHLDSSAVKTKPLQQAFTVRVFTFASVLYPVVYAILKYESIQLKNLIIKIKSTRSYCFTY